MRHDRRCFGRLGQEDQRLKNHYGHWMDIVDHAALRAQGGGRRRGLRRRRRGAGEDAAVDAHAERSVRVHWFNCGVRLPSPQNNRGVGEWRDGLASSGCSMGAVRPPRQHSRPREVGARGTTGAGLGCWSKKTKG